MNNKSTSKQRKTNRGAQGPKIKQMQVGEKQQHYIVPSACALKYAAVQSHPFEAVAGACIPDFFPLHSHNVRFMA